MHVDRRVRHRVALAGRPGAQQHRRHAGANADAVRRDVAAVELHRVQDRQAGVDLAAGRVDVDRDVAVRVFALQVQQLRDDAVRHLVEDRRAEEDDPLLEQHRVDVVDALAARRRLDDGGG